MGFHPNGFQDRLVVTASIRLHDVTHRGCPLPSRCYYNAERHGFQALSLLPFLFPFFGVRSPLAAGFLRGGRMMSKVFPEKRLTIPGRVCYIIKASENPISRSGAVWQLVGLITRRSCGSNPTSATKNRQVSTEACRFYFFTFHSSFFTFHLNSLVDFWR